MRKFKLQMESRCSETSGGGLSATENIAPEMDFVGLFGFEGSENQRWLSALWIHMPLGSGRSPSPYGAENHGPTRVRENQGPNMFSDVKLLNKMCSRPRFSLLATVLNTVPIQCQNCPDMESQVAQNG